MTKLDSDFKSNVSYVWGHGKTAYMKQGEFSFLNLFALNTQAYNVHTQHMHKTCDSSWICTRYIFIYFSISIFSP